MSLTGERSMNTTVRRVAVAALLVFSAACGSSAPTSVTSQPPAVPSTTPAPPTTFPALTGPARTFVFDRQLSYPVSHYTSESRFVLYDNGAFVLQYPSLGGGYQAQQVVKGLHDTFYGTREFIIRDLNRFWMTFAQF